MIQIGDTVVLNKGLLKKNISGKVGIVVNIIYKDDNQDKNISVIGVDFGSDIKDGHDCANSCEWGQGWWVGVEDCNILEDEVVEKKPKPVKYRDAIL